MEAVERRRMPKTRDRVRMKSEARNINRLSFVASPPPPHPLPRGEGEVVYKTGSGEMLFFTFQITFVEFHHHELLN